MTVGFGVHNGYTQNISVRSRVQVSQAEYMSQEEYNYEAITITKSEKCFGLSMGL